MDAAPKLHWPILRDGKVIGIIVFGHDVTDRVRTEQALRQSELLNKQVLVGQVFRTNVVPLRNPDGRIFRIGGILASAELAQADHSDSASEEFIRIQTAAVRGGEIVRQLMIYGGTENLVFEPVDFSTLIEEILTCLGFLCQR